MLLARGQFLAWAYLHTEPLELLGSLLAGCCLRVSSIPLWSELLIGGARDTTSVDEGTSARSIKVELPLGPV